jgi:hypothetical protein
MATTTPIWPTLVAVIRELRPPVRMKWSGDDEQPPWEQWIIVPSPSYLETGQVGPVPFREVEWVEIDPSGRDVEVAQALSAAAVPFQSVGRVFRVTADAG